MAARTEITKPVQAPVAPLAVQPVAPLAVQIVVDPGLEKLKAKEELLSKLLDDVKKTDGQLADEIRKAASKLTEKIQKEIEALE